MLLHMTFNKLVLTSHLHQQHQHVFHWCCPVCIISVHWLLTLNKPLFQLFVFYHSLLSRMICSMPAVLMMLVLSFCIIPEHWLLTLSNSLSHYNCFLHCIDNSDYIIIEHSIIHMLRWFNCPYFRHLGHLFLNKP